MKDYQLENIISLKNGELLKIQEIHKDKLGVTDIKGKTFRISYDAVIPVKITTEILEKFNFVLSSKKEEIIHVLYIYHLVSGSKLHHIRGYVYKNRSVWVYNNISLLYFHQLQNLFTILGNNNIFILK
jgi:hypothetical protein